MTLLSDREHDAFDNPAKALCREGNLRVLREATYLLRGRGRSPRPSMLATGSANCRREIAAASPIDRASRTRRLGIPPAKRECGCLRRSASVEEGASCYIFY